MRHTIKQFMKHTLTIIGLILLYSFSCTKINSICISNGFYIENIPIVGRSQLNFINNNRVIKSETGSNFRDTFRYTFLTGKIVLTPTWTTQYAGQEFDFRKIDDHTFQIENIYPSIPEAPKSYMTFKK